MSYDVAIVAPPIPDCDRDAWTELDAIIQSEGRTPVVFRKLHDRLTKRYPCLSSLPDDRGDESAWAIGPLLRAFGHRVGVVNMQYSRVKEALPFVIECAGALGLAVFDYTTGLVHRPNGLTGLILSVEDKPALKAPTVQQLHDAVDMLTPRGGPGFLCLEGEGPGEDYAQAAGGDGAYTAEWRKYSGQQFHHWVAGLPGQPSKKNIRIKTNGFHVTVKENERLDAAAVKAILEAFALGKRPPTKFAWRDVTERFKTDGDGSH